MSDKGWSRTFDDAIPLLGGGELRTLRDAGEYVTALSKVGHDKPHWQTAARELVIAAERGGILMLAEIAMRQALAYGRPEPTPTPRKRAGKKYRLVLGARQNVFRRKRWDGVSKDAARRFYR